MESNHRSRLVRALFSHWTNKANWCIRGWLFQRGLRSGSLHKVIHICPTLLSSLLSGICWNDQSLSVMGPSGGTARQYCTCYNRKGYSTHLYRQQHQLCYHVSIVLIERRNRRYSSKWKILCASAFQRMLARGVYILSLPLSSSLPEVARPLGFDPRHLGFQASASTKLA